MYVALIVGGDEEQLAAVVASLSRIPSGERRLNPGPHSVGHHGLVACGGQRSAACCVAVVGKLLEVKSAD